MSNIPSYSDITRTDAAYSTETVEAVGAFFLACATAETALTLTLSTLQCHPNREEITSLFACMGTQNKVLLSKVTQISQVLFRDDYPKIKTICEKIRRIFDHRNDIAHNAALMGSKKTLVVTPLKLDGKGGMTAKKITQAQIWEYTYSLYNLIRHLDVTLVESGLRKSEEYLSPTRHAPGHH
jgi:hypothetical protein